MKETCRIRRALRDKFRPFDLGQGDGEGESCSLSGSALDLERSTHALDELLRDGEAQARASEFSKSVALRLLKALKKFLQAFGRHPAPGVGDRKGNRARVGRDDRDADFAGISELNRVAKQVEKNLPEARGVAQNLRRNILGDFLNERKTFGADLDLQDAKGLVHEAAQIKRDRFKHHPTGLDFGNVQNIIQEVEEPL